MTVLLTGETGTGKTHLARLLHHSCRRQGQRLVEVSCGTFSARELASELFGHVRGAFPGAHRDHTGKLGSAGQGTILLDQVDALTQEQQAQLLRVLETGEYEPVGGTETRHCQARVIASCKVNLEEAVMRREFRQDLYFRLRVLELPLPPLRQRAEDIGPLVCGMLAHFGKGCSKETLTVSGAALASLQAYPWPGNIRQLRHVVGQAVAASSATEILKEHLPHPVRDWPSLPPEGESSPAAASRP
jgi:DNA-binding NtrC family response regulator